jgi:hypothetical protein
MASITNLRTALAENMAGIDNLRTAAIIPEDPKPPVAVVTFDRVDFDTSMGRGLDEYTFRIVLVVGRVDTRGSQNELDSFLSGSGANSLKTAIERDKTLGGEANSLRVTAGENIREVVIGESTYLATDFVVNVYA